MSLPSVPGETESGDDVSWTRWTATADFTPSEGTASHPHGLKLSARGGRPPQPSGHRSPRTHRPGCCVRKAAPPLQVESARNSLDSFGLERVKKHQVKIGGNINQCKHCAKQYGGSFKKLKIDPPSDPVILLLGIHSKKMKTLIPQVHASLCFLQHHLQWPRSRRNRTSIDR